MQFILVDLCYYFPSIQGAVMKQGDRAAIAVEGDDFNAGKRDAAQVSLERVHYLHDNARCLKVRGELAPLLFRQ